MKLIHICENNGFRRLSEYIHISIPCRRGEYECDAVLGIFDEGGNFIPAQIECLNRWHDLSYKWLHVIFCVNLLAGESKKYYLHGMNNSQSFSIPSISIVQNGHLLTINTGKAVFLLEENYFAPFRSIKVDGCDSIAFEQSSCNLMGIDGQIFVPEVNSATVEKKGPLHAVVKFNGHFSGKIGIDFIARVHFWYGTTTAKIEFTVRNKAASLHPAGLWDLGDPGSVSYKGLVFEFKLNPILCKQISYNVVSTGKMASIDGHEKLRIYQESSGGKEWNCSNHRNRNGTVPMQISGFIVEKNGTKIYSGNRAEPVIQVQNEKSAIAVHIPFFWQEFPNELEYNNGCLRASLFPESFPDVFELQGGEEKTKNIYIDFKSEGFPLVCARLPLKSMIDAEEYRNSGIFHDLPGNEDLVDYFTTSTVMLKKREAIDEYGWRNFGEVYADHESALLENNNHLISHYNNQYDIIYGFYRKFFITGDCEWKELASCLANHVVDIDIYHTQYDREEYNNGLFWHTDHYADAGLSTHRSYSKEQKASYALHTGGGGPGCEHCYTSGLLLHYFQTGDLRFKQAVIELAKWELVALSGPQTLLAAMKRFVDQMRMLRQHNGQKSLLPYYPLTRGTGNAIVACLDAYELSENKKWLKKAGQIIKYSIHPDDDIEARSLDNVEIAWSYTVFLSAVGKYLYTKVLNDDIDNDFEHARRSLQAYANWMLESEYPYLQKPKLLEYPNETWAAQELRKSVVFYYAAKYANDGTKRDLFIDKARYFYFDAKQELLRHDNSKSTRPVALMLQNGWVVNKFDDVKSERLYNEIKADLIANKFSYLNLKGVLKRFAWDIKQVMKYTNLKKEIAWLRSRIKN